MTSNDYAQDYIKGKNDKSNQRNKTAINNRFTYVHLNYEFDQNTDIFPYNTTQLVHYLWDEYMKVTADPKWKQLEDMPKNDNTL